MGEIETHIQYWINYNGSGDEYRKKHDLDCKLTNGNLYADTLISLWLPLRYVLIHENTDKWCNWLNTETSNNRLKDNKVFLMDLKDNLSQFIPTDVKRNSLEKLFNLGRQRCNVIILPYRKWNTLRGRAPYWDYMPHFLYDLLNTNDAAYLMTVQKWIEREHLNMFFERDLIKENIKDLCGTGNVCSHNPRYKSFNVEQLIDNYIDILEKRTKFQFD